MKILYFPYVMLCVIFTTALISIQFNLSVPISLIIYLILSGINFTMCAFAMLIKHGKYKENITPEINYDMDRCLYLFVLGPIGTLLIVSNIILNYINKL